MGELWTMVANRLLEALRPPRVLDVGEDGEFAAAASVEIGRWGGTVVSIAQRPRTPGRWPNLDVRTPYTRGSIARAGTADLVIVHGEPNWWTTNWQLAAVGAAADAEGSPLPPIVIAHAGSPWGRRDRYADPEMLPDDARRPNRRHGDHWIALEESTPRNGVLTAVEDFAQERGDVEVICVPWLGGAAVLLDPAIENSLSPSVRELLAGLRLSPHALALVDALETELSAERIRAALATEAAAETAGSRDQLQRELKAMGDRISELTAQLAAERTRAERAQSRASMIAALRYGVHNKHGAAPRPAAGVLSAEPSRELVGQILRPAVLVRALGWPGGEDQIARPIPIDRRDVVAPNAQRALVVISDDDAIRLRRTLTSILDRTTVPVALTIVLPRVRSAALDSLLAALELALPTIEVVEPIGFRPRRASQRLNAGEELPWGWPTDADGSRIASVAYLLPGIPPEGSGGAHSIVQEARGLRALGAPAIICVPANASEHVERVYGNRDALFVSYGDFTDLAEATNEATIAVATEHTSIPLLERLTRGRPELRCAYYVQDYEPLFAELGSPRSDRALLSYGAIPDATLFAKTDFVRNVVAARHGVTVEKVAPSLDQAVFNAEGRSLRVRRRLTVLAMIRPRTPRRRPQATLAALAQIGAALGDEVELVSFGCESSEIDTSGHPGLADLRHLGRLRSSEVADEFRRGDIFIDGSAYQAFGRTGLEAMACGAVPILPSLGGASEYAVGGENAILIDDDSPEALAGAVIELSSDRARLEQMRTAAVQTAQQFTIMRAARCQLDLFNWIVQSAQSGRMPTRVGT